MNVLVYRTIYRLKCNDLVDTLHVNKAQLSLGFFVFVGGRYIKSDNGLFLTKLIYFIEHLINYMEVEMNRNVHLKSFKSSELIFDNDETIIILKFIFSSQHSIIDELDITDEVREFAQGLLVEAVDASYAMGFIDSLFRATMNPQDGAKKVITKFGRSAAKHWFSHATAKDLMQIKIYDRVREQLSYSFGRVLLMYLNGIAKTKGPHFGVLAFNLNNKVIWS